MVKKGKTRILPAAIGLLMLAWAFAMPPAAAAPHPRGAAAPMAYAIPVDGEITVTALPQQVINGNAATLAGRCVNPSLQPVAGAGFHVGSDESGWQTIPCALPPEELSGTATVFFEAEVDLAACSGGQFRAFILCGGAEISSGALPLQARPPLPSPAISLADGAMVTAEELLLSWEPVEGAAYYGVMLRDITTGAGGPLLLGRESGDTASAFHWLDGYDTQAKPAAYRNKLAAGHTYRLTVCAAYDKKTVYGKSVEFHIITKTQARSIAPVVETGLYCKNGDGTVTLYGMVDSGGRPLAQYGFLVGKTANALQRMQTGEPDGFAGGACSLGIGNLGGYTGTLFYRAYAIGKNGVERRGGLQTIVLAEPDPFAPAETVAQISESYVPLLAAIDPGWQFRFIKKQPYNWANTEIRLLGGWEGQHILKNFPFPGKAIHINKGAKAQYEAAAARLNGTRVKVAYRDGSVASFLLKELVQTAASYNSRYIYPSTTDEAGRKLPPHRWGWRLSMHSWGASVDVNASVRVNRQKGVNFAAIRDGAAKLSRLPGMDNDGAVVLTYDGYPQLGRHVPDDVLNYVLYELAFKDAGFYWGAYFGSGRTDAMHYSLIEVPARGDIPLEEAKELPND